MNSSNEFISFKCIYFVRSSNQNHSCYLKPFKKLQVISLLQKGKLVEPIQQPLKGESRLSKIHLRMSTAGYVNHMTLTLPQLEIHHFSTSNYCLYS